LFPAWWRSRYGVDFIEHFEATPGIRKWADLLRSAAELRWAQFQHAQTVVATTLSAAIALVAGCDAALGLGMDERIDFDLAQHWWALPFEVALVASGLALLAGLMAVSADRRRRHFWLVAVAVLALGSFAGSATLAAFSLELAGLGAGIGLLAAAGLYRIVGVRRLHPTDAGLLVSIVAVLSLGWHYASSPIGPAILLVTLSALLALTVSQPAALDPS